MTTEEFHGMLMAALHGPQASVIVSRMFDVAMSDVPTMERVGELLGNAIKPGAAIEDVLELEILAHLNALQPFKQRTPESLDNAQTIASAKARGIARIRNRLRGQMRKSEAGRIVAASILLDLAE